MKHDRFFASASDAYEWLRADLFPLISQHIRLYKTTQSRNDEYIVIRPFHEEDSAFTPQIYRQDRDINDILMAKGLPVAVLYPATTDAGNNTIKRDTVLPAWRREPDTQRSRLTGLCYQPGGAPIINAKLNMFKDVSVLSVAPPDDQAIEPFLHHIKHNLCNGIFPYSDYAIKWLAHMVQRPHERPKTAIAFIGDQGTGKGIFVDFLELLLGGSRNCNVTASATDAKGFNFSIANKLLVVFDEATFAGDRQQSDFMKKLVTEPRIRVEQKGIDAYEAENFTRIMITSNNMTSAVPTGIGGRRFLIIECRNDVDRAWLKQLANTIGNNGPLSETAIHFASWFKHYLLNIDLSGFDPLQLPMQHTGFDTKLNVLYKEDPVKAFLWEWLRAPELTLYRQKKVRSEDLGTISEVDEPMRWDREVLFSDFYAIFTDGCKASYAPVIGANRIRSALEPYGATVVSRGGNVRYVALPHPNACLDLLRRSARFDEPISPEQLEVIKCAWTSESTKDKAGHDSDALYKTHAAMAAHSLAMPTTDATPTVDPIKPRDVKTLDDFFRAS